MGFKGGCSVFDGKHAIYIYNMYTHTLRYR